MTLQFNHQQHAQHMLCCEKVMAHVLFQHTHLCLCLNVRCLTNYAAACNFLIGCENHALDRCQPCLQGLRKYCIKTALRSLRITIEQ